VVYVNNGDPAGVTPVTLLRLDPRSSDFILEMDADATPVRLERIRFGSRGEGRRVSLPGYSLGELSIAGRAEKVFKIFL